MRHYSATKLNKIDSTFLDTNPHSGPPPPLLQPQSQSPPHLVLQTLPVSRTARLQGSSNNFHPPSLPSSASSCSKPKAGLSLVSSPHVSRGKAVSPGGAAGSAKVRTGSSSWLFSVHSPGDGSDEDALPGLPGALGGDWKAPHRTAGSLFQGHVGRGKVII